MIFQKSLDFYVSKTYITHRYIHISLICIYTSRVIYVSE